MLTLVATLALLHVTPQPADAPLEHPGVTLPPPKDFVAASRAQLSAELAGEIEARPSAAGFVGGGVLLGAGAFAAVFAGLLSGFSCGLRSTQCPVTAGFQVAIGLGIASMVAGVVWMIALGIVRSGPGQRIDALEEQLEALDEVEKQAPGAQVTAESLHLAASKPHLGLGLLVTRRQRAQEIDRQLQSTPPSQPTAPPTPAGSLLPPAPVLVGFSWPI